MREELFVRRQRPSDSLHSGMLKGVGKEDVMADEDEKGSKAYSLYSSLRRYFEPLREHWDKLTPQEQAVVIKEVEAFLNSVRPSHTP